MRVAPYRSDSVVAVSPNSGSVVLASGTIPSRSICATHGELDPAGRSATAREPCPVGKPARSSLSFTTDGMPASAPPLSGMPDDSVHVATAFSAGSTACARATAASYSSRPDTSPARSRATRPVTSSVSSASSAVASTRTVAASVSTQRR